MLSGATIIISILVYFAALVGISWLAGNKAGNAGYFLGNKKSPWIAIAIGMLGDSLSGVTYISVPGGVGKAGFSYMQVVMGYFVGYYVIAYVLLPLYYRLNLTSIYTYLRDRIGANAQRTGAFYFFISRLVGAAGRLYLSISVLQLFLFSRYDIPFWLATLIIIALILIYTYRGGIQSLVWTDVFQSLLLIFSLVVAIVYMLDIMHWSFSDGVNNIANSKYANVFAWDYLAKSYFWKNFAGGAFIAIAMTGLDQNMMQKNLSCRSLQDAQKNMVLFSFVMFIVTAVFVATGALLYLFLENTGIQFEGVSDQLFPFLAMNHLGTVAALAFLVGLTASTFSSADSVLTTLTTSFYIDFLGGAKAESETKKLRHRIHIMFGGILFVLILLFHEFIRDSLINTILDMAGYTYGPLLGLFGFGILTKRKTNDRLVPFFALLAPAICWLLRTYSKEIAGDYVFGHELLVINGSIMFGLLLVFSRRIAVAEGE